MDEQFSEPEDQVEPISTMRAIASMAFLLVILFVVAFGVIAALVH